MTPKEQAVIDAAKAYKTMVDKRYTLPAVKSSEYQALARALYALELTELEQLKGSPITSNTLLFIEQRAFVF